MAYELQHKPWKVWMSSTPQPSAVLTTLSDLLPTKNSEGLFASKRLGHDIIIYNQNILNQSGGVSSSTPFDQFFKYYIDLSPAVYDKRAKFYEIDLKPFLVITEIGETDTFGNLASLSKIPFRCPVSPDTAALFPKNLITFMAVSDFWKKAYRKGVSLGDEGGGSGVFSTKDFVNETYSLSIGVELTEGNIATQSLLLDNEDSVFSSTMVFEDGKKAYTTLRLNYDVKNTTTRPPFPVRFFILCAILANCPDEVKELFISNTPENPAQIATYIDKWVDAFIKQSLIEKVAPHLKIWVKAPFAADYIDPKNFNQDLDQEASVVHRNLLISSKYDKNKKDIINDFNPFDDERITNKIGEENTAINDKYVEYNSRPYTPKNSPVKDLLSKKLLTLMDIDLNGSVKDIAKSLIEKSYKLKEDDRFVLRGILAAPHVDENNVYTSLSPLSFYDPESRKDENYYADSLKRIPTLIGKDGNITTDGRIFSPTIDELWYIVKKMISGQDVNEVKNLTTLKSIVGEKGKTTTLTEVVEGQYGFTDDATSIFGDPIDFEMSKEACTLKEYVVQPVAFKHKVYSLSKKYADYIRKFAKDNTQEATFGLLSLTGKDYHTDPEAALNIAEDGLEDVSASGKYLGPRSTAPLSLRELEAIALGNKFNIENNFIYSAKTFGVTGKFGKQVKNTEDKIISGGSLYQFHRDYNGKVDDPNTYFAFEGDGTELKGTDAVFNDLENPIVPEVDLPLLDENFKKSGKTKTYKAPLLVVNYGNSSLLSKEQGEYTGAEVYLSAEGTWRHKNEHVRLPILRSRY